MKNIKIYEQYLGDTPIETPDTKFEIETTDFKAVDAIEGDSQANYEVIFKNADGKNTRMEIAGASNPKFVEDEMMSIIPMIKDSSSDGREYKVIGFYEEIPDSGRQFELKRLSVEEK